VGDHFANRVFFGDTHLHSSWSTDVGMAGATLGPDVTVPIASSTWLRALVNARFIWEFGARTKTDGQTLVITATFPIPSIPL